MAETRVSAHASTGLAMPEHAAQEHLVLRVEISADQVDAFAPRLREALSASGNDGELSRRTAEIAARAAPDRARGRARELGRSDRFGANSPRAAPTASRAVRARARPA